MANKGGFSWKRATGITGAKRNISRKTGIPLTKSGRQRKIGKTMTGSGCLVSVLSFFAVIVLIISLSSCIFDLNEPDMMETTNMTAPKEIAHTTNFLETTSVETTTSETTTKQKETTSAPETTASKNEIEVISLTSPVRINNTATIKIKGKPNTAYTIAVYYSTTASSASGLERKVSDHSGTVAWSWKVGARVSSGRYKIVIRGGGESCETYFTVYK